jgi:uncharacterized protein
MKNFILCAIAFLLTTTLKAQDITGQWNGVLDIKGTQLRLVFNITKTDNILSATMDSPDQGAKGIPTTSVSFDNAVLKIAIANAKIDYEGKLGADNTITGTFKQGSMSLPLNLSKTKVEKITKAKPQEPTKPYPYYSEDVVFENTKDKITLAGTLTLPKKEGNYPVVVLISGSGPQNRDEEALGHKPFLVLADYLTRNGIGVLRYDDRGVAESKGNFQTATSQDFATDAEAAVNYLKTRKEVAKIGLIGHSEGGIVAPMVVAKSKDVNFIVLLAGTGILGSDLLLLQTEAISKIEGESDENIKKIGAINKGAYALVTKSGNLDTLKKDLVNYLNVELKKLVGSKMPDADFNQLVNAQASSLASPWMQFFIKYNPAPVLEDVKCPVLALNGANDRQVPSKINLEAIKNGLAKGNNKSVTIKELPNLNHLFQESATGAPSEYGKSEQTFSPTALAEITNWILGMVR